jgi:quercetin dioxygenase-like cupin family protein
MVWSLVVALVSLGLGTLPVSDPIPSLVARELSDGVMIPVSAPRLGAVRPGPAVSEAGTGLCVTDEPDGAAAPSGWVGAPPLGATTTILAEAVVDQIPAGLDVLHLSHLALAPLTTSPTYTAVGPLLLAVQDGTVTLYLDGAPVEVAAGVSATVQSGQLYALANETPAPATLLRLTALPPSDDEVEVADFVPAAQISLEAVRPELAVLVQAAPVGALAPPARLFLACVHWTDPGANTELHQHPGVVGMWIERGALVVDDERTLPAQGCAVFAAGEVHQARAGEAATTALLFGVVPESEPVWQQAGSGTAGTALDDVTCGDAPPE